VNSLLIALFIGRVVPRHIGWSKQQHQLVKSKNIMRRAETINKKVDIFLVDSLRGYCCEPSQHTGNRLVFLYDAFGSIYFKVIEICLIK
jgi:hypothetical protein